MLSIAWKSTVSNHFVYWSLMISSIQWYFSEVHFHHELILSNSSSHSMMTFKNRSGWSAHLLFQSILYFSQSFFRTDCHKLLSLRGRIASNKGEFGSIILSNSTWRISQSHKQWVHAHSCLLGEKCCVVNSGYVILQFGQYILSVNHWIVGTSFFVDLDSFSGFFLLVVVFSISIFHQNHASTFFEVAVFSISVQALYTQNFFVSAKILIISSLSLQYLCSSSVIRSKIQ